MAQGSRHLLVRVCGVQVVEIRKVVAHDLHRHLARDLAGRVSAHAVRDYEKPAILVGRSIEGILIALSNSADISASRDSKVH